MQDIRIDKTEIKCLCIFLTKYPDDTENEYFDENEPENKNKKNFLVKIYLYSI